MKKYLTIAAIALAALSTSCVSSKKFKAEKQRYTELEQRYASLEQKSAADLKACNDEKSDLAKKNSGLQTDLDGLNKQVAFLKENNTQALKQLQDLSVISASQAESIKKSLENMGAKDAYIQDLQTAMARKDSLNMALVLKLKGAVGDMNDQDINIKVDKGVVYIDISDKMLFKSGKYEIAPGAQAVLAKVAKVLQNQAGVEFMVEGHTDNVPFKSGVLMDNWDLSVKRATAVVRVLQNKYGIPPALMTAAGRGEYRPLVDNGNAEDRAVNRRTRIIILPQLDQFFKLLEPEKKEVGGGE
jgi:chemotaxis protein MotB